MSPRVVWLGLGVILLAAAADGQVNRPPVVVRGYPGAGWWGGVAPGYTGTTPAESYARGMSEVIRARGDAYEAATRGAISYEQARASYLENQARWQEMHLQRKAMLEQQRQQQVLANRAANERRQSGPTSKPPELLSDVIYDRASGAVHWPEALAGEGFSQERVKLDEALKVRARTGDHAGVNQQIIDLTEQMQSRLKSRIREMPPANYLEAHKFLDQLAKEMQLGLG